MANVRPGVRALAPFALEALIERVREEALRVPTRTLRASTHKGIWLRKPGTTTSESRAAFLSPQPCIYTHTHTCSLGCAHGVHVPPLSLSLYLSHATVALQGRIKVAMSMLRQGTMYFRRRHLVPSRRNSKRS